MLFFFWFSRYIVALFFPYFKNIYDLVLANCLWGERFLSEFALAQNIKFPQRLQQANISSSDFAVVNPIKSAQVIFTTQREICPPVNLHNTHIHHSTVFSLEGRDWQEPKPIHVNGMAVAHCILGKFFGVVYHSFPLPLDVPTLAARLLRPQRCERS